MSEQSVPIGGPRSGWFSGVCAHRADHRLPDGPCEDLGQCGACGSPTFVLRPAGETFGFHAPDCSLAVQHERRCVGGGSGHPPGVVRGYWPGFEQDVQDERERWSASAAATATEPTAAGRAAYTAGLAEHDNPFPADFAHSAERLAWKTGWLGAASAASEEAGSTPHAPQADLSAPGWVLIAGGWRWVGAGLPAYLPTAGTALPATAGDDTPEATDD